MRSHQSDRDSAIYEALKRGPSFPDLVQDILLRDVLVSEAKKLIAPAKEPHLERSKEATGSL